MNALPVALKISKSTFKTWVYIPINSKRQIPLSKMAAIAGYFNVKVEDLMNEEIPILNPRKLEELERDKVAARLGLHRR